MCALSLLYVTQRDVWRKRRHMSGVTRRRSLRDTTSNVSSALEITSFRRSGSPSSVPFPASSLLLRFLASIVIFANLLSCLEHSTDLRHYANWLQAFPPHLAPLPHRAMTVMSGVKKMEAGDWGRKRSEEGEWGMKRNKEVNGGGKDALKVMEMDRVSAASVASAASAASAAAVTVADSAAANSLHASSSTPELRVRVIGPKNESFRFDLGRSRSLDAAHQGLRHALTCRAIVETPVRRFLVEE